MRATAQRARPAADAWVAMRLQLEQEVRSSGAASFRDVANKFETLAPYATPAALLDELAAVTTDKASKDALYGALVHAGRTGVPAATVARAVLWLGLWPGLDAVHRRVRRLLPHRGVLAVASREDATSMVTHAFLEEVARLDVSRSRSVAATLVRNTERRVTDRLRIEGRNAKSLRALPTDVAAAPIPPSELGLPPGLPDDDQVDFIRQSLIDLVGRADARLIVGAVLLGENLRELAVELEISHEAVRKRLQRALRVVRQRLALDVATAGGASSPSTAPWRMFARGGQDRGSANASRLDASRSPVNRVSVCPSSPRKPLLAGHEEASMTTTASTAVRFSPSTVTRQPDRTAHKFILTGRSGIGKTFFVSTIPGVFIIPVEEGLKGASPDHDPAHFSVVPRSLRELHQALDAFVEMNGPAADKKRPFTHLAIDSVSGIEALVHEAAQEQEHARHMDAKDYKVVWSAAASFWGELQRKLDTIRRMGVHVWLIAHASEAVEATATGETFRKWDLAFKGSGGSLAEVRQFWRAWADHVFFLDWVAKVVPGSKGKRSVGKYEGRVLHTRESATYYAKTRARLPPSIPATWEDLTRALAAGSIAPEAKLRAHLAELLPQLEASDRAILEAELATAKGANRVAALVSRAQGMLALSREDQAPEDAVIEERDPDTSRSSESPAADAEAAAPVELTAAPVDDAMAPTDPAPPAIDPMLVALAAEFERQIDAKTGAELEALPDAVKAAHLPAPLEARVRSHYIARVRALKVAPTRGESSAELGA